jgi:uncharacterized protein
MARPARRKGLMELLIICISGAILGVMGAIIGSTLLVLVPLLSFFGLPIQAAIGTAKVSVITREVIPAIHFHRHKLIKLDIALPFSISAVIASVIGSMVAVSLDAKILETIVAVFMVLISIIMLSNPKLGLHEKPGVAPFWRHVLSIVSGAFIGLYTGIFGGGANVFILFVLVLVFGNTFLQATANSKIPNMIITAVSIPMFIINDYVQWEIAIPLAACTAIGSHFGAKLAIRKGSRFIRFLFVGLVMACAVRYLFW